MAFMRCNVIVDLARETWPSVIYFTCGSSKLRCQKGLISSD